MLILGRDRAKDPAPATPAPSCASSRTASARALDRGVKIVTNAGGLNPAGLAAAIARAGRRLGLTVAVGARRRRRPARRGRRAGPRPAAGRQRLPGRLRASPSAWRRAPTSWSPAGSPTPRWSSGRPSAHFGWRRDDYDALAGAMVAGHVIECGTQATGGNYAFFTEIAGPAPARASRSPRSTPTAPASSPSTPAPAARSPSARSPPSCCTRSAAPRYAGPDVTARFDTIELDRRTARTGYGSRGVRGRAAAARR